MTNGKITIDRALFKHPVVGLGNPAYLVGWVWLLSEARWKDCQKNISGKTINLERGQLSHSIRFISKALDWSRGKTERFVTRLKTETMIETDIETGQLVITICNYDKYQLSSKHGETDTKTENATGQRQDKDRTKTNYNKGNKGNKDEKKELEKKYSLEGKNFNVTVKDYNDLRRIYYLCPDVIGTLYAADLYYHEKTPDKNCYAAAVNWVKKEHAQYAAEESAQDRLQDEIYAGID